MDLSTTDPGRRFATFVDGTGFGPKRATHTVDSSRGVGKEEFYAIIQMYFLARFGGSVSVVADRVPADTSGSDCCGNPCSSVDPRTSAAQYHRRIEYHYEKFRNSIGRFYESPGTNVIEHGNNKERQEDPAVDRASVIGTSFEVRSFLSLVTRRARCTMLVAAISWSAGSEVKSSSVEVRQRARSGERPNVNPGESARELRIV